MIGYGCDMPRLAPWLMFPERMKKSSDTLRRVNGEPGGGKVTRVAERSNEGLTKKRMTEAIAAD